MPLMRMRGKLEKEKKKLNKFLSTSKVQLATNLMAPPYSNDLRWRIVWLRLVQNMSLDSIASLMSISERILSEDM